MMNGSHRFRFCPETGNGKKCERRKTALNEFKLMGIYERYRNLKIFDWNLFVARTKISWDFKWKFSSGSNLVPGYFCFWSKRIACCVDSALVPFWSGKYKHQNLTVPGTLGGKAPFDHRNFNTDKN